MLSAPDKVERSNILTNYVNNAIAYYQLEHPEISEDILRPIIRKIVKDHLQRPTGKVITYPQVGDCKMDDVDLITLLEQCRDKVITPSGAVFYPTNEKKSLITEFADNNVTLRKNDKKEMYAALESGDKHTYKLKDFSQYLRKIRVNSITGAERSEHSAFYDPESFCGTTSLARHGVMLNYGVAEQFLTSNYYLTDLNILINFIVITLRGCPAKEKIDAVSKNLHLYQPIPEDVIESLTNSMPYYLPKQEAEKCKRKGLRLLYRLEQHKLTYLFYRRNLFNVLTYNSEQFKPWIFNFINTDVSLKESGALDENITTTPESAFDLDEDLLVLVTTLYNNYLENQVFSKKLLKSHPDVCRKIATFGYHMQQQIDTIWPIFEIFFFDHNENNHCSEFVANIPEYRKIRRQCVAISDTDSILYTVQALVKWYMDGHLQFEKHSFGMCLFVIFALVKTLGSLNKFMAIVRGAVSEANATRIQMKNEFFFPVLVRTLVAKHYFGIYESKEGRRFETPVLDVKGVNLQSSNLPSVTKEKARHIMHSITQDIRNTMQVSAEKYIGQMLDYERHIYDSLNQGELTYCTNVSIKPKAEYKSPEKSIWINYELWMNVFAEEYGPIHIPGKYPLIPLKKKGIRTKEFYEFLKSKNPEIAKRLKKELDKLPPKKEITRLPMSLQPEIPDLLRPLINIRKIIYRNMSPMQLILYSTCGILVGPSKKEPVFHDCYPIIDEKTGSTIVI